jgi:Subtilase family
MNQKSFGRHFFVAVLSVLALVVLLKTGLGVKAQGDAWHWKYDPNVFDNLRPGIAYHTDTILFVFRREKLNKALADTPGSPSHMAWLKMFLEQANIEFRRNNLILRGDFNLKLDKTFPLTSVGLSSPQICDDGNELVRVRIESSRVNLTLLPSTRDTMVLVRDVIKAAQGAIETVMNHLTSPPGVVAADYINWPLPNGGQIPSPSSADELPLPVDIPLPVNTPSTSWAVDLAYGTNLVLPSLEAQSKVVVAVLDTGQPDRRLTLEEAIHPRFCSNTIDGTATCRDGYGRDGGDRFRQGTSPTSPVGHGAGIEGIISSDNYGVARGVKVKHIQVCAYDQQLGGTECPTEAIIQALCKAPRHLEWSFEELQIPGGNPFEMSDPINPQVINLSLGSAFQSDLVKFALEDVTAANVVVVTAAGNSRDPVYKQLRMPDAPPQLVGGLPMYPAQYANSNPGLVAVGAIDRNNGYAKFATVNSYVTLSAPGVGVITNQSSRKVGLFSGTSFAAPFVSGGAALVIAKYKSLHGGSEPKPETVINLLKAPMLSRPTGCLNINQCGLSLNIGQSLQLVQ